MFAQPPPGRPGANHSLRRANPSRGGGAKPGVRGAADRQAVERRGSMGSLLRPVVRFLRREDGPTSVEYAVMLALIIVVCIVAVTSLGSNANQVFSNVALNTAVTSS